VAVCAELKATNVLTTGSKAARDKAITAGAKLQGVPVSEAITATEKWPNIPVSQEKSWLVPAAGQTDTPVTKAYELTARFLKSQGVLAAPPGDQALAGLTDASILVCTDLGPARDLRHHQVGGPSGESRG
jgi:hypothetical protein